MVSDWNLRFPPNQIGTGIFWVARDGATAKLIGWALGRTLEGELTWAALRLAPDEFLRELAQRGATQNA